MRILKSKHFARFMKDTGITNADLREAVRQAKMGLIDADLGGVFSNKGLPALIKANLVVSARYSCFEHTTDRFLSTALPKIIGRISGRMN